MQPRSLALPLALVSAAVVGGCATSAIDDTQAEARRVAQDRLGAELRWLNTEESRHRADAELNARLAKPISADDSVRIALAHSPALQAVLAESAAQSAETVQASRLTNPVFTFERLARGGGDAREFEISRMLTVPLLDLLLLPTRMRQADQRQQQLRLQLAGEVVLAATEARAAWVRAVAARQALAYSDQTRAAAEASAELARRMQTAGNFSKLQRAQHLAFEAEARAQHMRAEQAVHATREALVRALGLDATQAEAMKLPDRLPDLPAAPRNEQAFGEQAMSIRLDLALARARAENVAREQGLASANRIAEGVRLGIERNSTTGQPPQRGYQLELPVPIFDTGDAARAKAEAEYLAVWNRHAAAAVQAASELREAYAIYQSAYELARYYRDEIVPLRQSISEENLLRYNGMQIGVFELLADARDQIASVSQALDAQRDFWLADAALQAAAIGRPATFDKQAR